MGRATLAGIHLSFQGNEVTVGEQQPSGPDGAGELGVRLLGQADEDVGLGHLGEGDVPVGDDHVRPRVAPPLASGP